MDKIKNAVSLEDCIVKEYESNRQLDALYAQVFQASLRNASLKYDGEQVDVSKLLNAIILRHQCSSNFSKR